MNWVSVGALWGLAGVGLGAFGAHGLRNVASPEGIGWWETAALYHLFHGLALLAVGLLQHHRPGGDSAGWYFLLGSAVFSGTLYAMALGAPRWLRTVTPLGGLGMMVGWLLLALHARGKTHHPEPTAHQRSGAVSSLPRGSASGS